MSFGELNNLKEKIEKMTKNQQIEVLRILKSQSKAHVNENNNGSFINLSELDEIVVENLKKYVSYIDEQQKHLLVIENEKDRLQTIFFKGDKDNEKENIKV